MPFGQGCQFKDFDACVATLGGKVDDPNAACGWLKDHYECRAKHVMRWADSWPRHIPLGGKPLPFSADVKVVKMENGVGVNDSLHLRLASPRARATWGFSIAFGKLPDVGKSSVCHPKQPGPMVLLESSPGDGAPFVRKAAGTYRLGSAADGWFEVFLKSNYEGFNGRLIFRSLDDTWIVERPHDQQCIAGGFQDLAASARYFAKRGARLAVLPRDPLELSLGYSLIDIEKVVSSTVQVRRIVKVSEEQRYTLGVGYPASEVDAHGEYMNADELEKAAWLFMRSPNVGLMHKGGTEGAGEAVESYIYRGPKWQVEDQSVDAGDWLVGVVWSPEAWSLIKRGSITGFSMQGWAKRKP